MIKKIPAFFAALFVFFQPVQAQTTKEAVEISSKEPKPVKDVKKTSGNKYRKPFRNPPGRFLNQRQYRQYLRSNLNVKSKR